MEPENVKDALQTLLDFNRVGSNLRVKDSFGNWTDASVKDLQDVNNELLCYIADSLGMSELYLGKDGEN